MFRIGVLELGLTCALVALAVVIPLIVTRGYAKMNRRLKDIEGKLSRKK